MAQTDTEPARLNALFDRVILADTFYKTSGTTAFPENEIVQRPAPETLRYSAGINSWSIPALLDQSEYTDAEKIAFLQQALADKSRDAFSDIYAYPCRFWSTSSLGKALIDKYFQEKQFEKSEDPWDRFRYFRFRTSNIFPETYPLILDYFQNRDRLVVKYYGEGNLVYTLIQLGKEAEALAYLDMLTGKYAEGKIPGVNLGASRNTLKQEGNVFDYLCLSENPAIAQKSTDLLFKYLSIQPSGHYELDLLAAYLDQDRYAHLLQKRFEYFSGLDFSSLNYAELAAGKNLNTWNKISKLRPDADAYITFMEGDHNRILGARMGKALWSEFIKNRRLWELTDRYASTQFSLLESALQDKSISTEEQKNMLLQLTDVEKLIHSSDIYGDFLPRLLRLITQVYPGNQMPREDFERLHLGTFLVYASPLDIRSDQLEVQPFSTKLQGGKIDETVQALNRFATDNQLKTIQLNKKQRFYLSLNSVEWCVNDFFSANGKSTQFDAESSAVPSRYADLFQDEFQSLMNRHGMKDIRIGQSTDQTDDGRYSYHIYVQCRESIYQYSYTEPGTDWYDPQRLVKMLNLCLIDKKVPFRLVGVETGDQTVLFFLMEPAKIKPLLDRFGIACWAVRYDDAFRAN